MGPNPSSTHLVRLGSKAAAKWRGAVSSESRLEQTLCGRQLDAPSSVMQAPTSYSLLPVQGYPVGLSGWIGSRLFVSFRGRFNEVHSMVLGSHYGLTVQGFLGFAKGSLPNGRYLGFGPSSGSSSPVGAGRAALSASVDRRQKASGSSGL